MVVPTELDGAVMEKVSAREPAEPPARRRARLLRFRERIRTNAVLNTTWRVGIFVVGWLTVIAGLAMMVLPGPGIASVVVGFAILATEFVWARHALRRAKRAAIRAKEQALDPRTRRRNRLFASVAFLVAAGAVATYLSTFGFALPPLAWLPWTP